MWDSSDGQVAPCGDDKENSSRDTTQSNPQNSRATESRSSDSIDGSPVPSKNASAQEDVPQQRNAESRNLERSPMDPSSEETSSCRAENLSDNSAAKDFENTALKDSWQFEVEKSIPWLRMIPSDQNLSKQMFLYLTHNDLKCKMDDISQKETQACSRHCWDDALRLRDMKNKLELIREKRLYNMASLDLDDESRKLGLVNIDKREGELLEREQACTDSTMYSEDARDLWKKWVHEDDKSVIKDVCRLRETLMNSLETEWQGLAIHDKERITQLYRTVINEFSLQGEHKFSYAINASRKKSFASSY